MKDTIFALATAPGRSAVAIVRLTGPKVGAALSALGVGPTRARLACLRSLYDAGGELIDRAIVLRFAAPRTFTGEPMAELHVHGGEAVVDAITAALLRAGLRAAEAGEITRRAFENGKLDLDQAEAVADLIDASTSAQARQAAQQLRGALGRRYQGWRETLITALARLEAQIDFADEELPAGIEEQAATPLRTLGEVNWTRRLPTAREASAFAMATGSRSWAPRTLERAVSSMPSWEETRRSWRRRPAPRAMSSRRY